MTKSALMDAAWPGMAVEEGNLSVQIASLRKLLGPSAAGGDWIATVPRVGYRFTGTVETVDGAGGPSEQPAEPGPSIAVLPFANLSDDTEQQYFADGLAEDIITNLARLRWLFVSARNSSFTYRSKTVDAEAGRPRTRRSLCARRQRQALRTAPPDKAELSDASSGLQIWAERYDVDLADFLAIQDQIAESVIAAIEPHLYAAEHQRFQNRSPESLDAWGFVMKAMPHVWNWLSAQEIEAAEALLKRAIDIDPEYARANSLLAWTYASRVQLGWADARGRSGRLLAIWRNGRSSAIRSDPWTHFAAGYVHMVSRHFEPGGQGVDRSDRIEPKPGFCPYDSWLRLRLWRHGGGRPPSLRDRGAPEPARFHGGSELLQPGGLSFHRRTLWRRGRMGTAGRRAAPAISARPGPPWLPPPAWPGISMPPCTRYRWRSNCIHPCPWSGSRSTTASSGRRTAQSISGLARGRADVSRSDSALAYFTFLSHPLNYQLSYLLRYRAPISWNRSTWVSRPVAQRVNQQGEGRGGLAAARIVEVTA